LSEEEYNLNTSSYAAAALHFISILAMACNNDGPLVPGNTASKNPNLNFEAYIAQSVAWSV
jgi:hypothetical protein